MVFPKPIVVVLTLFVLKRALSRIKAIWLEDDLSFVFWSADLEPTPNLLEEAGEEGKKWFVLSMALISAYSHAWGHPLPGCLL